MHRPASVSRLAALLVFAFLAPAGAQEPAPAETPPAPPPSAPNPRDSEHTWYAQALARGRGGLNVTHFWSRGPKLRAETVVAGHKVVTIVSGEWYYAYDGLTGHGLAIRRDPNAMARDAPARRPFGREYESLLRQGGELVREEDLMGRKAGVYRVTDDRGRRELWATLDEEHLPLRIEIYDRRRATRRYTDYLNWQSRLAIPEDFFEPDPNAKLQTLGYDEYLELSSRKGSYGPVPILYVNLLHVPRSE